MAFFKDLGQLTGMMRNLPRIREETARMVSEMGLPGDLKLPGLS